MISNKSNCFFFYAISLNLTSRGPVSKPPLSETTKENKKVQFNIHPSKEFYKNLWKEDVNFFQEKSCEFNWFT